MTIDWNAFTPYTALGGGVLIGLASAWLILMNGRIAGISGILGGCLTRPRATAAGERRSYSGYWPDRPSGGCFTPFPLSRFVQLRPY